MAKGINVRPPSYGTAISKLRPDCVWIIYENNLSTLEWSSENSLPRPTDAEITAELETQMAAFNAKVPFILIEEGYTGKTPKEIKHDYLIKDFVNFDKIINNYL